MSISCELVLRLDRLMRSELRRRGSAMEAVGACGLVNLLSGCSETRVIKRAEDAQAFSGATILARAASFSLLRPHRPSKQLIRKASYNSEV